MVEDYLTYIDKKSQRNFREHQWTKHRLPSHPLAPRNKHEHHYEIWDDNGLCWSGDYVPPDFQDDGHFDGLAIYQVETRVTALNPSQIRNAKAVR